MKFAEVNYSILILTKSRLLIIFDRILDIDMYCINTLIIINDKLYNYKVT